MSDKYQVVAIIPNGFIVLKFIEGENPVNTLILGSIIPVTIGEPVNQEDPEFNR